MTATLLETPQETPTTAEITHTVKIHTQNALPAAHRIMTDIVRNVDTPTLIRDGLGKTIRLSKKKKHKCQANHYCQCSSMT